VNRLQFILEPTSTSEVNKPKVKVLQLETKEIFDTFINCNFNIVGLLFTYLYCQSNGTIQMHTLNQIAEIKKRITFAQVA